MTAAKKVLDKITSYSSVVIFIAMVLMVNISGHSKIFLQKPKQRY